MIFITLLIALLFTLPLAAQNPVTAQFPGAVASDNELSVATDRWSSTLNGGIDDSVTAIDVVDASGLTVPSIITIEAERILCTGKTANQLTSCTRGYGAGSSAAAHSTAVNVRANFTAAHLNLVFAEIIAIETELGADLANVLTFTGAFTNKSIDAEGTGNVISEPIRVMLMAAGSAAGTAAAAFNTPSSNAPAAVDKTAGGFLIATLDFDKATDESVQWVTKWPVGGDESNADLVLTWFGVPTVNEVTFAARSACLAAGEAISDLAWNATKIIVDTAAGTTLDWNTATIDNLALTNCADSEHLWIEFLRDADASEVGADDDFDADASVVSAEIIVRVTK